MRRPLSFARPVQKDTERGSLGKRPHKKESWGGRPKLSIAPTSENNLVTGKFGGGLRFKKFWGWGGLVWERARISRGGLELAQKFLSDKKKTIGGGGTDQQKAAKGGISNQDRLALGVKEVQSA